MVLIRYWRHGHSLEEISAILDISNLERVRQIQSKALRKIQHPTRFKRLLNFLKETPPSEDAIILVRAIYPDKTNLLEHGLRSSHDDLTDFGKQVIKLCYRDETLKQADVPIGRLEKRRSVKRAPG